MKKGKENKKMRRKKDWKIFMNDGMKMKGKRKEIKMKERMTNGTLMNSGFLLLLLLIFSSSWEQFAVLLSLLVQSHPVFEVPFLLYTMFLNLLLWAEFKGWEKNLQPFLFQINFYPSCLYKNSMESTLPSSMGKSKIFCFLSSSQSWRVLSSCVIGHTYFSFCFFFLYILGSDIILCLCVNRQRLSTCIGQLSLV